MKKLVLSTLIAAGLAASQFASAAALQGSAGTINFTGKIVNTTCKVTSDSQDINVVLPTLSTGQLSSAGAVGGYKTFQINLENCKANDVVKAYFQPRPSHVDAKTGRLKNTGTAKNVQIQLLDADHNDAIIDASKDVDNQGTSFTTLTGTTATLTYAAQYYATEATEAGDVKAIVQYDIAYQ